MKRPAPSRLVLKALLVMAAPLLLGACKEEPPAAKNVRPAQVWTVGESGPSTANTFSGEVKARHEADLAFQVGGKVAQRLIETGQSVRPQQVLARLDTSDLDLGLASARANLAAAEADLSHAEKELARLKPLYAQKFIPKSTLDGAQASRDATAARVHAARAQMKLSDNQARYTELRADRAGIITHVGLETGQVVAAGAPVLRIAYDGEREVHVRVGETSAQTLHHGDSVQVTLWAHADQPLAGRVREIAPATDITRSFLVKVSLLAPPTELRLGMSADIVIPASTAPDTHALPASALFQRGRETAVWVLDEGHRAHLHPVAVQSFHENGVRVRGLAPGARVIAAGTHTISAGQEVRPLPYDGLFRP
ncbi:MAG: efflux RND transporter periplasmic adaptor subunit [Pseudomonadota bacterium]